MKTNSALWRKVWDGVVGLLIVFSVFLAYGNLPNRWYHILYINSGSMAPAIRPGDLIIITPPPAVLKPRMILTLAVNGSLVTHRLVGFGEYGALITQGDANVVVDDWPDASIAVIGVYRARIPYLGYLAALPGQLLQAVASGAWFSAAEDIPGELSAAFPAPATPTETATPTATPTLTPEPLPTPSGTSLEAVVTAGGYVSEDGAAWGVRGQVCATNTGEWPTDGLSVMVAVEYKDGRGKFGPLPGAALGLAPAAQLQPGEQACLDYDIPFGPVPGANYRTTVTVTILNHSGWLPGGHHCAGPDPCPFGPAPKADFDLPRLPADQTGAATPVLPEQPSPTAATLSTAPPNPESPVDTSTPDPALPAASATLVAPATP